MFPYTTGPSNKKTGCRTLVTLPQRNETRLPANFNGWDSQGQSLTSSSGMFL